MFRPASVCLLVDTKTQSELDITSTRQAEMLISRINVIIMIIIIIIAESWCCAVRSGVWRIAV